MRAQAQSGAAHTAAPNPAGPGHRGILHDRRRLPHVARVGADTRAAWLGRRSIKTEAKAQGIRMAVSMVDLTTLEGADTPGKVHQLAAKAVCPAPASPEI